MQITNVVCFKLLLKALVTQAQLTTQMITPAAKPPQLTNTQTLTIAQLTQLSEPDNNPKQTRNNPNNNNKRTLVGQCCLSRVYYTDVTCAPLECFLTPFCFVFWSKLFPPLLIVACCCCCCCCCCCFCCCYFSIVLTCSLLSGVALSDSANNMLSLIPSGR
ncbi:unnamed protein product [Polarella glacialis]|uniref:Uncharacterized protein n=1 Tax=Polarella glacialis TaxID=89957 RepID=A0A813KH83_POLGL|nr:unnamed protein product [Polarella glacialis]